VEDKKDLITTMKEVLFQNILSVPGIAAIYSSAETKIPEIEINKTDIGLIININIICFFSVNIWVVMKQAQMRAKYTIEKISNYQDQVEVNINVCDLIEE